MPFVGKCYGHESQTVSSTAVSLGSVPTTVPENEFLVGIITVTEEVRVRLDGTAPTSTVGYLMHPERNGAEYIIEGKENLDNLQLIRVSSNAVLNVTYMAEVYRRGED